MQATQPSASPAPRYNLMRQKLGAKGAATRQRIVDTAARLIDVQTGELPSISLICRAALTSKATFYQYFEDFGALAVELLRPADADVEQLAAMLAEDWPDGQIYERSYAFVAGYFDHWDKHRVPLRLRDILADSGDPTMIDAKLRSIDVIVPVLARKLCATRGSGRERRDDHALAIALMNAIVNAAMVVTHNVYPKAIDDAIVQIHGCLDDCQHRAVAHLLSVALQHSALPMRKG